jgi:hypothetical protein
LQWQLTPHCTKRFPFGPTIRPITSELRDVIPKRTASTQRSKEEILHIRRKFKYILTAKGAIADCLALFENRTAAMRNCAAVDKHLVIKAECENNKGNIYRTLIKRWPISLKTWASKHFRKSGYNSFHLTPQSASETALSRSECYEINDKTNGIVKDSFSRDHQSIQTCEKNNQFIFVKWTLDIILNVSFVIHWLYCLIHDTAALSTMAAEGKSAVKQ